LCDWHVTGQWTLVYNPRCALALHALAVLEHRVRLRFDQAELYYQRALQVPPKPFISHNTTCLNGHNSTTVPGPEFSVHVSASRTSDRCFAIGVSRGTAAR
jgi:hypothetical protein